MADDSKALQEREHQRFGRIWNFLRPLAVPIIKRIFHYDCDDLRDVPGPYLLLSNHNADLDPALVGMSAWHQSYFVASEHLVRAGRLGDFLTKNFGLILHVKGKTAAGSALGIMRTLKAGHNVILFPEGTRSFNGLTGYMSPATGKLARRSGASLVTFRLEGLYLTNPRWGKGIRKGRSYGHVVHVYSPAELKAMTDAQVQAAIERDLFEDAYATQAARPGGPVAFKGENLAEGLESTLFCCPGCGRIGVATTTGDEYRCDCGFHATYEATGYLTCSDGQTRTVTQWDAYDRERLRELLAEAGDAPLFSDTLHIVEVDEAANAQLREFDAKVSAYPQYIEVGDKRILADDLEGIAIIGRNHTVVHLTDGGKHYEVDGASAFSALKYLYLFDLWKKER